MKALAIVLLLAGPVVHAGDRAAFRGGEQILRRWMSPVPRRPPPRFAIPDDPPMPPMPPPVAMARTVEGMAVKASPSPLPTRFGPQGEIVTAPGEPVLDERYPSMTVMYPKRISEYPPGNLHFHFEPSGTNDCVIQRRSLSGDWRDFSIYRPTPGMTMQIQAAFTNQVQFRLLVPREAKRKGE